MSKTAITLTKNYRMFGFSTENRKRDAKKHKKLMESMRLYGFLPSFPIVCVRNDKGELVVKDGQHRLMFAEELGLPVAYVVESTDFDVAVVNSTAKVWALIDYAEKFAENGVKAYVDGLEFANQYRLPIGTAFSLLAGTTTFSNIMNDFIGGTFKIKDRQWADMVAYVYRSLIDISPVVSNKRCIEAVMAACRIEGFDTKRLIDGARRNRESLVAYSTKDGYLDMLERLYNFGRRAMVPVKINALQAMRDRSAVNGAAKKSAKQAA